MSTLALGALLSVAMAMPPSAPQVDAAVCDASGARRHAAAFANDNRSPAGSVRNGVLTVRLEARSAMWYPDGPGGCPLRVHAFAERGGNAQIPGPLLRMRAGAEVVVEVRNALPDAIWMRGLQDRTGGPLDSTEIAAGATHAFHFRATAPGAWYYWAGASGRTRPSSAGSTEDGQLVGALVIDPKDGPSHDRVFVMTRWAANGRSDNDGDQVNAINGLSWPHTERVVYTVGDSIRWHVINASDALHMMHLHGFYFHVDRRGDPTHDSLLTRQQRSSVVTTATRAGEWISITWVPDRAGNWLFHCHFTAHMSGAQRLGPMHGGERGVPRAGTMEHMAGLLLGVTVRAPPGQRRVGVDASPQRVVQLFADMRPGIVDDAPRYGFVVQEGLRAPPPDSIRVPGSPIILTRGEPVAITVHNRTASPFSLHWHGIELQSYYDGVAGWSGSSTRLAPVIAPGDSFVAHITPRRAGTFMYHVHNEPGDELSAGLYAPLIVLEPGARYEPETDHVVVIASGRPGPRPAIVLNGSRTPDTVHLAAGRTHRLRMIDISANEAQAITLRGPSGIATWRLLARDGRDVPPEEQLEQPARFNSAAGITRDFAFVPLVPGDYVLRVDRIAAGALSGQFSVVPIRVHAP